MKGLYRIKRFFKNESLIHKSKFHRNLKLLDDYFFSEKFPVKDKFEYRSCIVCSKSDFRPVFRNPSNYEYVACNSCGMVMMNPTPSADSLHILYNSEEMSINASGFDLQKKVQPSGKSDLAYIRKFIISGSLLDIGCGVGGFLKSAAAHFESEGLEINKIHAEKGISEGLKIYNTYSSDFHPDKKYDIITLKQVIEHLFQPSLVINDVKRLLNSGGYFYVACPNFDSVSIKLFGSKHRHFSSFGHINMFTADTMRRIMQQEGFEVIDISTYYLDVELHDLFYHHIIPSSFVHRHAGYNAFAFQLFQYMFKPFRKHVERKYIGRNQGSYLQCMFRKK